MMQTPIYIQIGNVGPQGASGAAPITPLGNVSPYTAAAISGPAIFTIYNTSSAPFTFNLPAAPAVKQQVQVIDGSLNAQTYAITIQGNGKNISVGGTLGMSSVINTKGGFLNLVWDGTQWSQAA